MLQILTQDDTQFPIILKTNTSTEKLTMEAAKELNRTLTELIKIVDRSSYPSINFCACKGFTTAYYSEQFRAYRCSTCNKIKEYE